MRRVVPLLLIAAIAAAAVVDHVWPARPVLGTQVQPLGGAQILGCPAAVVDDGRAYIHVANLGTEPSDVRITVLPERGKDAVVQRTLGPGMLSRVRIDGRVKTDASAIIQSSGGEVVATHTLWFPRTRSTGRLRRVIPLRGGAGATCSRVGAQRVVLPHLRTKGRDTKLVLFNPGAANAEATVALLTSREVTSPESLTRQLIPPRGTRVFDLADHAFNVGAFAAVVESLRGRVVAEVLSVAETGVTLTEGIDPVEMPLVLAGASGRASDIGLVVSGAQDTALTGTLISATGRGAATRLPADMAPAATSTRSTPRRDGGGPVGYVLEVPIGGPLGAGTSWRIDRRGVPDLGAVNAIQQARRWLGVIGSDQKRSTARVIILNPTDGATTVQVRVAGSDEVQERTVEAGRLIKVNIGTGKVDRAVEVTAPTPIAVMVEQIAVQVGKRFVTTYAFGVNAVPIVDREPVRITYDERDAVPAPRGR